MFFSRFDFQRLELERLNLQRLDLQHLDLTPLHIWHLSVHAHLQEESLDHQQLEAFVNLLEEADMLVDE